MQLQDAVKSTASHSECHAGLFTAYQAARRILLDPSNSILKIICSTFQHVLLPSNTKVAEVHKVVNNGFHIHICDWEAIITCAFHALHQRNKHFKSDFQTLSLPKSEIDFLPDTGSHDLWDSSQKLIIFVTWYLVHEMSRAIGTILEASGAVKTRHSQNLYAYDLLQYSLCLWRAWILYRISLGWHLKAVKQQADETKIEYLILEIQGKYHRVDEDQWFDFYQNNIETNGLVIGSVFRPLKAQLIPTLKADIPTKLLKGRKPSNTTPNRPYRIKTSHGILIR